MVIYIKMRSGWPERVSAFLALEDVNAQTAALQEAIRQAPERSVLVATPDEFVMYGPNTDIAEVYAALNCADRIDVNAM